MIDVPIAQGFRLRRVDDPTALPNFDNTFDGIETGKSRSIIPWRQYCNPSDVKIQVVTPDDNENFASLYLLHDDTEVLINTSVDTVIGLQKYTTFTIPLATYDGKLCRLKVVQVFNEGNPLFSHLSEPFEVASQSNYLKLQWFNIENGFLMDYSGELVHELYLDARMDPQPNGGDISVIKNQGKYTKLKEVVNRIFTFSCIVPAYIAEAITLASAHDCFYINEVEFIREKKPSQEPLGNSNLFSYSMELVQKNAIGINTHDTGFNVD